MHQWQVQRNLVNAAKHCHLVGKSPHATVGHNMFNCPFKCDYIEHGRQCTQQCNYPLNEHHTECQCGSHWYVKKCVIVMRMGIAQMRGRRQCRNPDCSYVVGDPDNVEHYCCGCCQAHHQGTAEENWQRHGWKCSSVHAEFSDSEAEEWVTKRKRLHQPNENDMERRTKAMRTIYGHREPPMLASSTCWAGVHRWKPANKLPASDGWDDYGDVKQAPSLDRIWDKERPPWSLPDSVALLDERVWVASILSSRVSVHEDIPGEVINFD